MRKCAFVFTFFVFYFTSFTDVKAQSSNLLLQSQCIEKINTLKIDVFRTHDHIFYKDMAHDYKTLWKNQNIVFYNSLRKSSSDFTFQEGSSVDTTCNLFRQENNQSQKTTYHIQITPYFFNTNPSGHCGNAETFEVTIKSEDHTLLDRVRFWKDCRWHDSAENDQEIDTIIFSTSR